MGLDQLKVKAIEEVRKEEPPVDPFESLNERNRLLSEARTLAASISDPSQVLIHGPTKAADTRETVTLEELTPLVRQAAEAALLRRPKRR